LRLRGQRVNLRGQRVSLRGQRTESGLHLLRITALSETSPKHDMVESSAKDFTFEHRLQHSILNTRERD
jgi:hypothetical protein